LAPRLVASERGLLGRDEWTCLFRPPKTAKGKTLQGKISFTAREKRFTKRFSTKLG